MNEDGMKLAVSLADFWADVTLYTIDRRRRRGEEVSEIEEARDLATVAALTSSAEQFRSLSRKRAYSPIAGLAEAAEVTRHRIPELFRQMLIAKRAGKIEQALTWQSTFGTLAALAHILEVMAGNEDTIRGPLFSGSSGERS